MMSNRYSSGLKMHRRRTVVLLLVIIAWLLNFYTQPDIVVACSCFEEIGVDDNGAPLPTFTPFELDLAIFSGQVTAVEIVEEVVETPFLGPQLVVTFSVHKSWNRVGTRTVTVVTAAEQTMCGYPFELGNTYLVYGVPVEVNESYLGDANVAFGVSICGDTKRLAAAAADLAYLAEFPATEFPLEPETTLEVGQQADNEDESVHVQSESGSRTGAEFELLWLGLIGVGVLFAAVPTIWLVRRWRANPPS